MQLSLTTYVKCDVRQTQGQRETPTNVCPSNQKAAGIPGKTVHLSLHPLLLVFNLSLLLH